MRRAAKPLPVNLAGSGFAFEDCRTLPLRKILNGWEFLAASAQNETWKTLVAAASFNSSRQRIFSLSGPP